MLSGIKICFIRKNLNILQNKTSTTGYVKCRDEYSVLKRTMDLEKEGRRPASGRPKKTWSKVVEEDIKILNITEDKAEDRKQWRLLISRPTQGVGD